MAITLSQSASQLVIVPSPYWFFSLVRLSFVSNCSVLAVVLCLVMSVVDYRLEYSLIFLLPHCNARILNNCSSLVVCFGYHVLFRQKCLCSLCFVRRYLPLETMDSNSQYLKGGDTPSLSSRFRILLEQFLIFLLFLRLLLVSLSSPWVL